MHFENALEMYEFELNHADDEDGQLTDGFYSSEEDERDKDSHSQSDHSAHRDKPHFDNRPESAHLHEEQERNWYPELDVKPENHSQLDYENTSSFKFIQLAEQDK